MKKKVKYFEYFWMTCRQTRDNTYEPTTWQIKFDLDSVNPGGTYVLRIAVASATFANLRVRTSIINCSSPIPKLYVDLSRKTSHNQLFITNWATVEWISLYCLFFKVRINENRGQFSTGRIGRDNSIARHGIHGLYWLYSFNVRGSMLRRGTNTIYLTQTNGGGKFPGLMYDYLRLEGPRT